MKLKFNCIWIIAIVMLMGTNIFAVQSVTWLRDGRSFTGTLLDMSSRTGVIEYYGNTKIHRNEVWMINYADKNWNFPDERSQLSSRMDTLILHNGQVLHESIIDFSSRRRIYEFRSGRKINESQVRRIYFCCEKLPAPYQQALNESSRGNNRGNNNRGNNRDYNQNRNSDRYASVFLVTGRTITNPLKYLNGRKTGFMDGLQINTHDIWMINLEGNRWNYADERRELDSRMDSIFLNNGEVLYDVVVDFNVNSGTFSFENSRPIHESQISRIYFCCNPLPEAYRNNSYDRRRVRRR